MQKEFQNIFSNPKNNKILVSQPDRTKTIIPRIDNGLQGRPTRTLAVKSSARFTDHF
jgi:hypothetical protein